MADANLPAHEEQREGHGSLGLVRGPTVVRREMSARNAPAEHLESNGSYVRSSSREGGEA